MCFDGQNSYDWRGCTVEYSGTTPLPPGPGNLETNPRFMNAVSGDFRLRHGSPCMDAGSDLTALLTTDILGLPRPPDGDGDGIACFDKGAFEFALPTLRFAPNPQLSPDGFHFTVLGEPGRTVRNERSRDLRSWETVRRWHISRPAGPCEMLRQLANDCGSTARCRSREQEERRTL